MKKIFSILLLTTCIGCKNKDKENGKDPDPNTPKALSYSIITTYPHDTSSYTQGLLIYKGELYEGTGNLGFSKLKKVELKTGKTIKEISLDKTYFGEGVTILNDTIYQLTWKNKKVLVYTLPDFKKVKEFDVDTVAIPGWEGWGLTTDGKHLIASTGSSELYYFEPASLKLVKAQTVTESGSPTNNINELEYIDGYLYANQYQRPYVLKIDPSTGQVVAKVDLTNLWGRIKAIDPDADVPNGIAYDSTTKKIYITGKWWPELYEVEFSQ